MEAKLKSADGGTGTDMSVDGNPNLNASRFTICVWTAGGQVYLNHP